MTERVHVILDAAEKERWRRAAAAEGKALSEWLREAAAEKLAAEERGRRLDTRADLEAFFRACDDREVGLEPDWAAHRGVIEESIATGAVRP